MKSGTSNTSRLHRRECGQARPQVNPARTIAVRHSWATPHRVAQNFQVGAPQRAPLQRVVPAFKSSGDITSLSQADGYIEIPAQTDIVEKDELVEVTLF